jgi:hypothetical protein
MNWRLCWLRWHLRKIKNKTICKICGHKLSNSTVTDLTTILDPNLHCLRCGMKLPPPKILSTGMIYGEVLEGARKPLVFIEASKPFNEINFTRDYCGRIGKFIIHYNTGINHPCDLFSSCDECIRDSQ